MMKNKQLKKIITVGASCLLAAIFILNSAIIIVFAYFSKTTGEPLPVPSAFDVNDLFGRLDGSSGAWGTEANPYLIYNQRHLKNLYTLQNTKDYNAINENTVFQVSDKYGNPVAVGGGFKDPHNNDDIPDSVVSIPSIGSEDFPFISTIRGITNESSPVQLTTGEYSSTSVLGNIRITGYEGQIDIGLFGVVGDVTHENATSEANAVGSITNLLLSNIQIETEVLGAQKDEHPYYNTPVNHETNHIGILAGHAQNSIIKDISVYYSGTETPSQVAGEDGSSETDVAAILIAADDDIAKYTSSGGIIGYYQNIFIGEARPVSTESNYDVKSTGGGNTIGSGTGVMFSGDLWNSLSEKTPGGLTENSYRIQTSFGYQSIDDLYYGAGSSKLFFTRGVFTFAHSFQLSGYDNISKLWTDANSKTLTVATNGQYTERDEILSDAKKFECTRITDLSAEPVNTPASAGYRYMIVYTYGGTDYVLTRNANAVSTQQFVLENEGGTNYITLASAQIKLYSAMITTPYTAGARTLQAANKSGTMSGTNYDTATSMPTGDNANDYGLAFYYGPYPNDADQVQGRPLRAFSDGLTYADVQSGASVTRFYLTTRTGTAPNITFRFKRARNNYSIHYTASAGFTQANSWGGGALCALYRIDTNEEIDASEIRKVYEPGTGAATHTYDDMDKRALFYSGTGYNYNVVTIDSLGWGDENMERIKQVDTALVMSDPATYYNTGSETFGLIPVTLAGGATASVPQGTVAFRVQGTGVANDTAQINIIVATNPDLLVDQSIACAYFAATGTDRRTQVTSFPLPPAPGISFTPPVYLTDSEAGYSNVAAYMNFKTVLVAYSLQVPCNYASGTYRTYFLESTLGAASFVYFAIDRTASEGRNPEHENELFFPILNNIDYVYAINLSGNTNTVINVTNSTHYVHSLIVPYFGYAPDASTVDIIDDFIIVSNYNLSFSIRRTWVRTGTQITPGYGELYITANGLSADHVNFTENVYVYTESGLLRIIYSDHVVMNKDSSSEVSLE